MKYQTGQTGRIIIARFEDNDDILAGLTQIARKENIRAASFNLVGGMRKGDFVVGPETDTLPPKPVWRQLGESHEVVGFGTIFWEGETPKIHLHAAFGKKNSVKVGCLREHAETFLVLEAVITEIKGVNVTRELDTASNMVLLKV